MLKLSQLTCQRGGRFLFRDLDARLASGALLRVTGTNGSGKTTLLRLLAGLLPPDAGSILWADQEIRKLGERYHAQLLWHGHPAALNAQLDALENLRFLAASAGLPSTRAACLGALEHEGLESLAGLPCRLLSQGQQRRVALARLTLGGERPLWLLDEAFTALDAGASQRLAARIEAHCARGGCVVLSEHQGPALRCAQQQITLGGAGT